MYAMASKIPLANVPPDITDSILDYMCQIDYLKVEDPGDGTFSAKTIGSHVTQIDAFVCEEIFNATKDLRSDASVLVKDL